MQQAVSTHSNLLTKLVELQIRYSELCNQQKSIDLVLTGLETELKNLSNEQELLNETWETLRDLLDKFSAESLSLLKTLLEKGLGAIFHDREYTINIEISDTKFKKLKFVLVEKTDEGITETDLGSGALLMNGGGVLVVVSFILQVFLINMYGKRKFIAIDEGFTNISSKYVENFFRFLKYLHTEMEFDFLMVNHDTRFMPYFDKVYEVNMGVISLKEKI